MSSLQTWLLHQPFFPVPLPPSSRSCCISPLISGLKKHFNAWGNWQQIEKNIVDRAQKAAVHAAQLCSRKPLVQRCHLLSIHHPEHRVCKSCVAHPACRFPTPVPRFLQHLFSYGLAVALKTLWTPNFHLDFVMLLPFLPCHYSYDKAEKPGKKVLEPPFPPHLSICFQGILVFSKPFPDTLNLLGIN